MSVLILATSNSGKSTFARDATSSAGIPLVDGDDVVGARKLWPKEKQWWRRPGADKVQRATSQAVAEVLRDNPDIAMLWWADLRIAVPLIRSVSPKTDMVGVIIPKDVLKHRWECRQRAIAEGKSRHSPRDWEDVLDGWEKSKVRLKDAAIPLFESLDAAARHLKIHVRKHTD